MSNHHNVLQLDRDSCGNIQKELITPDIPKDGENEVKIDTRFSSEIHKRSAGSHIVQKLTSTNENDNITYISSTDYDNLIGLKAIIFLNSISVKEKYKKNIQICYHHNIGHNILYSGECKINKEHYAYIDTQYMDMHSQFLENIKSDNKRKIYQRRIGSIPCLENWQTYLPNITLTPPQPFHFTKNTRVSIPILKGESKITFEYKMRLKIIELLRMRILIPNENAKKKEKNKEKDKKTKKSKKDKKAEKKDKKNVKTGNGKTENEIIDTDSATSIYTHEASEKYNENYNEDEDEDGNGNGNGNGNGGDNRNGNMDSEFYKLIKVNLKYLDFKEEQIATPELWGRYSDMTEEERKWRKSVDDNGDPVRQVIYYEDVESFSSSNEVSVGNQIEIKLEGTAAAKHIFWCAQLKESGFSNYTTNAENVYKGWSPCMKSALLYSTSNRVPEMGPEHFSLDEAYDLNWPTTPTEQGYNVFTYTFNPSDMQNSDVAVMLKQCGAVLRVKLGNTDPFLQNKDELDDSDDIPIEARPGYSENMEKEKYRLFVRVVVLRKMEVTWSEKKGALEYFFSS